MDNQRITPEIILEVKKQLSKCAPTISRIDVVQSDDNEYFVISLITTNVKSFLTENQLLILNDRATIQNPLVMKQFINKFVAAMLIKCIIDTSNKYKFNKTNWLITMVGDNTDMPQKSQIKSAIIDKKMDDLLNKI